MSKPQDTYEVLKKYTAVVILALFVFSIVVNVLDDLYFGNRISGGVDPLLYGLVGTLVTLVFAGRRLGNSKK